MIKMKFEISKYYNYNLHMWCECEMWSIILIIVFLLNSIWYFDICELRTCGMWRLCVHHSPTEGAKVSLWLWPLNRIWNDMQWYWWIETRLHTSTPGFDFAGSGWATSKAWCSNGVFAGSHQAPWGYSGRESDGMETRAQTATLPAIV